MINLHFRHLTGRCANGYERDGGDIVHALQEGDSFVALCGAKAGKRSAGWSVWEDDDLTCMRCLLKAKAHITPLDDDLASERKRHMLDLSQAIKVGCGWAVDDEFTFLRNWQIVMEKSSKLPDLKIV